MTSIIKPLETKSSANRNVHTISFDRMGNMILAPGPFGRNAAIACIMFLPVCLYLCEYFNLEKGFWMFAVLLPIFAAGGFLVGYFMFLKFGTRVILNSSTHRIIVSGLQHDDGIEIDFDEVVAVQRIYAPHKGKGSACHPYQINLVLSNQSRYNLLDSGGLKQLDKIGEALSRYIGVPFNKYDKNSESVL